MEKRNKLLAINGTAAVIMQFVTMICGLILPRLILSTFGSNVNGLITSITQFLSFISLLDGGLGAVVRAAYYNPMAAHDNEGISRVYAASNKFYRQIAGFFAVYVIVLSFLFPFLSGNTFDYFYTFSLTIIISLSTMMQYFWGYTLKLFVFSDQRGYLHNITQIFTTIINTILSAVLIHMDANIHIVKFIAVLSYIVQPLFLGLYIRTHYNINYKAEPDGNMITGRWSAFTRHIAFYIHSNTDIVIIMFFMGLSAVSVYSVYRIVVNGLTNLLTGIIGNTEATFGNLLASEEAELFIKEFKVIDLLTKSISTVCFVTCTIMVCPFVNIYTSGITDVNYNYPVFAAIMCVSEWIYCMGLNYNNVIVSVGHFKQTTKYGIIEAGINIIFSLIMIKIIGLEGAVVATAIAMIYKMIANIIYMEKNIVYISISYIARILCASALTFFLSIIVCKSFISYVNTYWMFFMETMIVFLFVLIINIILNYLFCKEELLIIFKNVKTKKLK
ncbi:MAG: hypothetical protein HFG31_10035 [Eubacterium sp.]|jgi:O-antigen/teichoic acid export membrane protein|nr:hypothetical protein [Eubacterium sp.]